METNHAGLVMWTVGTGIVVIIFFVGIVTTCMGKKVDNTMCNTLHKMLGDKLCELSADAKETIDKIHKMNLALENIRGMIEVQSKMGVMRWTKDKKSGEG